MTVCVVIYMYICVLHVIHGAMVNDTQCAQFKFRYVAENDNNSVTVTFSRRTEQMPPVPSVRAMTML